MDRQRSVITKTSSPNNHKSSWRARGVGVGGGGRCIKHIHEQSGRRDKEATVIWAIYIAAHKDYGTSSSLQCWQVPREFASQSYAELTFTVWPQRECKQRNALNIWSSSCSLHFALQHRRPLKPKLKNVYVHLFTARRGKKSIRNKLFRNLKHTFRPVRLLGRGRLAYWSSRFSSNRSSPTLYRVFITPPGDFWYRVLKHSNSILNLENIYDEFIDAKRYSFRCYHY